MYILLLLILPFYLYLSIKATIVINKSIGLTNLQRQVHIIMSWLIPGVWFYLFQDFLRNDTSSMTKTKRQSLGKKNKGDFHESQSGFDGGFDNNF